eukprot:TRINITY_DN492_c0_g1_i1.p1 TRINITY_DN492_c0_g1~~TRINITY_DN492_c0_g1_i1.p1  ORF type:complete len:313 (+),score=43.00 TRINITY_DN492_c0_g1_i1:54-941(+)
MAYQHPPQGGRGYPPAQPGAYGAPPPGGRGYPPQQPPPGGRGYPPQQPPPGGRGYPPQGQYPPAQQYGGAPPPGAGYPPHAPYGGGGAPAQAYGQAPGTPQQQQQNSSAAHYYSQVSQQEMGQLQAWFSAVDRDRSGQISAKELAQMDFGGVRFGPDTARLLIKVFDVDRSGEVSFYEYAALHKFIMSMKQAFYMFDADRSGSIDQNELSRALSQGGFYFSPQTIQMVLNKFKAQALTQTQRPGMLWGKQAGLGFEQFLQVCAFLGVLRSSFEGKDPHRTGSITVNLEGLVQLSC